MFISLSDVPPKKNKYLVIVRILKDIPEIIGKNLESYGPFKKEDIATIPKENAKSLIKQGAVIEVETK